MSETPIFDQLVKEFEERRQISAEELRPVSLVKHITPTHSQKEFTVRPLSYLRLKTEPQPEYLDDTIAFQAVGF